MDSPKTLFDKVWDNHMVGKLDTGQSILYIDRHLGTRGNKPQAFEGLKLKNRNVRRPDLTLGVADHNVPTFRNLGIDSIKDKIAEYKLKL